MKKYIVLYWYDKKTKSFDTLSDAIKFSDNLQSDYHIMEHEKNQICDKLVLKSQNGFLDCPNSFHDEVMKAMRLKK